MYIGRATAQVTAEAPHQLLATSTRRAARARRCKVETDDGCHTRGADWIASAGATTSPEAATAYIDFPYYLTQATVDGADDQQDPARGGLHAGCRTTTRAARASCRRTASSTSA